MGLTRRKTLPGPKDCFGKKWGVKKTRGKSASKKRGDPGCCWGKKKPNKVFWARGLNTSKGQAAETFNRRIGRKLMQKKVKKSIKSLTGKKKKKKGAVFGTAGKVGLDGVRKG